MVTEHVGLLGWPVGHSISPEMHHAAFNALGLDWRYDLLPVSPEEFDAAVRRYLDDGYLGFNVTIPHKARALDLPTVSRASPAAQAIGAANTLIRLDDGTLVAENTDWQGFLRDLYVHEMDPAGQSCLLLGTGGSARAIAYALHRRGAARVLSVSRQPGGRLDVVGYDALAEIVTEIDLVINCTPLGMSPNTQQSPWPDDVPFPADAVLYDLVYNPPETVLMQQARRAGARAINGLGMLVWQGVLAFELWTGQLPPVDVMMAAARSALGVE